MTLKNFRYLQAYSTLGRSVVTYKRDLLSSAVHRRLPAIPIMYGLLLLLKLSGWEQALVKLSLYRKHISFILHFIVAAYLAYKLDSNPNQNNLSS